jgi:hypothetical protein
MESELCIKGLLERDVDFIRSAVRSAVEAALEAEMAETLCARTWSGGKVGLVSAAATTSDL